MNNTSLLLYQTYSYKIQTTPIIRGDVLTITINNLPLKSGTPYQWLWDMRQEPAFVNGIQDWISGTEIQAQSGTLATNATTSLTIVAPIPLAANQFAVGNYFSFTFVLSDGVNSNTCVQVVFYVGTTSTNPQSPALLPSIALTTENNWKSLNSTDVSNINFGGNGLLLSSLPDGLKPTGVLTFREIYRNGQLLNADDYIINTSNYTITATATSQVWLVGDIIRANYYGTL